MTPPDDDRSIEDLLDAAGALSEDAPLDAVGSWLENVKRSLNGADAGWRRLVREGAVDRLRPIAAVSSPARLADTYLDGGSPDAAGDDLQGETVALDDPEPWPEEVDGARVLDDLEEAFTRHLALPSGAAPTLALWTVHAHAHDASPISPVLAVTSPEKRCGKTTLLELLSALVPRPLPASNVTAATVFRAVEAWRPTLLVDEADTFLRDGSELRGVLNSGHLRSQAYVPRCVGDDHEVRQFRTWAPKAVALIGELPDTLGDRAVEIRMRRRAPDEEVERLRRDRLEDDMAPLRRRSWTWAREREDVLRAADPADLPECLHDRERDNWRPLIAISDVAGGRWPERARDAARTVSGDDRGDRSRGTRLLEDVRRILKNHPSDRIRSKKLVERLCGLEEAPWSEYKGRGLSTVSLANFLRRFDVSSKTLRFSAGTYKGYEADAFAESFRRYLPSPPPEAPGSTRNTRNNPRPDAGSDGSAKRNAAEDVTPSESGERPGATGDVTGVTPSEGEGDEGGDAPENDLPELPF